MRIRTLWRLILTLLLSVGILVSLYQQGQAATTLSSVTAGLSGQGQGRVKGTDPDGYGSSLSEYPDVTVKANNLAASGSGKRITTKTNTINVSVNGQLVDSSRDLITAYYVDLLDKNGNSITTASPTKTVTPSTTVTMNVDYTFTNVDLTKLKDQGPIYIAYCFSTNYKAGYFNKYFSQKIDVSDLYPAITTDPVTPATTTLKGTGTNVGDTITNDATDATTTVGSDKTWTLSLDTDALKDKNSITVTEFNDFGDRGSATVDVTNPVTIDADKTSLNLTSDDVTELQGMSDGDFADWVISQAHITGKPVSESVTVKTDTTGLADALKKVADNGSMTLDFYATNGTSKSATKTITLVKPGTVKFGTVSDSIDFGSHGVPTVSTLFGPTTGWDVNINDTREAGSKWYLYATATNLTSGTHTMPGYVMYRDANGQTSDLTKSTLIDSGERGTSADTSVTSDWTTDPKATDQAGIFLDVEPGVYADISIKYSGAVNWTLSDVPTP